jgi:hypothetical protein
VFDENRTESRTITEKGLRASGHAN